MSWKLTCRDAGDGSGDVILELESDPANSTALQLRKVVQCDVCDASTAETGHGVLQAQWRDGEAEGMRLCRSCFSFAMSTLKRERWVRHMFDDDEPGPQGEA